MRLFEMLLFFLSAGLLVLLLFLNNSIRRIALLITSGVSSTCLIIHLLVEGYRVQLLFPYCFTVLMLILSLKNYFKAPAPRTGSRVRRVLGSTLIVMALFITAGLMYIFPISKLPVPTGNFKVGTQAFHFVDRGRDEIFSKTANGKRELMVQVWYPAQNISGKPASFIPDAQILKPMARNYGLPSFTFEHLRYILSHSYKGADISSANGSYPLVIINPGYGSSRFLHTSQAENLASHGYIVVAIDHTYNTFATVFPDGRITTCKTDEYFSAKNDYQTETGNRDKVGKVLTDDVAFTIDQFEQINSGQIPNNLKGKLDLSHIGVLGHSIGGATAYDSSYDNRITAGIDLDGGLYNLRSRAGLDKPFMFICSEGGFEKLKMAMNGYAYTEEELKEMGVSKEWKDKETEDKKVELEHMRKVANIGGQIVYIENSGHLNFADVQFISPIFKMFGMTGKIDPGRADSIINAYTLDFFDRFLKNKGGSLFKEPNSKYPEVKFVTSLFTNKNK